MDNSRGMTPEETAAIKRIAEHLFDTTYAKMGNELDARTTFIQGFIAGRVYTINQFEDLTSDFERND